jgi:hypothetical protein
MVQLFPAQREWSAASVHWVRPDLVAEVKYLTWIDDNLLRQVIYEGLRGDKPASEVRRPVPHPKPLAEEGSVRSTSWSFAAVSLGGTSYLRLPRLLQWFTGNIGFHHVHHVDPRIPQLVSLKVLV